MLDIMLEMLLRVMVNIYFLVISVGYWGTYFDFISCGQN